MQDTQDKSETQPHPWLVFQDALRKVLAAPKEKVEAVIKAERAARAAKRKKRRPSR